MWLLLYSSLPTGQEKHWRITGFPAVNLWPSVSGSTDHIPLHTPLPEWEARDRVSLLGIQPSSLQSPSQGSGESPELPVYEPWCTFPWVCPPEWCLWIISLYLESRGKCVIECHFTCLVHKCCSQTKHLLEHLGSCI